MKTSAKTKTKISATVIVGEEMDKIIKTVKSERKAKNTYLFVYFGLAVLVY